MNGCVIPNTPIAVDFWKIRECPQTRLFFLTHLHGDHIAGLTSSWHYPIYCSEITSRLLKHKFGLKEEFIKVLEVGAPSIVFLDRECTEQMTVTAIDANHCPGAVMYLFEGYFGRILHTGDFRFKTEMVQSLPLSHLSGKINALYLDNTYCSPLCRFPGRDLVKDQIIHIIKTHPNHDVVIGMRNLGKEDLLYEIAVECNTWISVPSSNLATLRILEAKDVFKNDSVDCRVRVVPFHKISNKFVTKLNEDFPTIVILPTALYCGIDAEPYVNQDNVFVVPYSDHSSYTELETFVAFLRPCSVIPVVKSKSRGPFGVDISARSDMTCFQRHLNTESKYTFSIPASVKSFMENHRGNPVLIARSVRGNNQICSTKRQKSRGIIYQSPCKLLQPIPSEEEPAIETNSVCDEGRQITSDRLLAAESRIKVADEKCCNSNNLEFHSKDKKMHENQNKSAANFSSKCLLGTEGEQYRIPTKRKLGHTNIGDYLEAYESKRKQCKQAKDIIDGSPPCGSNTEIVSKLNQSQETSSLSDCYIIDSTSTNNSRISFQVEDFIEIHKATDRDCVNSVQEESVCTVDKQTEGAALDKRLTITRQSEIDGLPIRFVIQRQEVNEQVNTCTSDLTSIISSNINMKFNVLSNSARQKSKRRTRMYKALCNGIKKMN